MKKIYLAIALMALVGASKGQGTVPVGQTQLNLGVGFSDWGTPFYLGLDYGAARNVTVGGELSFRSYDENWNNGYYRRSITGISGNANYHFNSALNIPRNFDFYAGLNLGFYVWSAADNGYQGNHSSGLGLGAQVGGRYYFTNKFGVNLEFGGGNAFSGGKVGITLKL